jgi:alcohol dehydrogenase class IV
MTPMIAIPTTSGTGSEATHFAVLYKDKTKYSIAHSDIVPDVAIIHSPFTYNVPAYLAACTGFDALAQAIEAYWNINATKESDIFAAKALELLWNSLPAAVNKQINEDKDKIAEGAYWAGKAINITQTTAPHAMSYAFTSYYGIPHGHAVALTFPYFVLYNIQTPYEEYRGKESYESFQKRINNLYNLLALRKQDNIYVFFKEYIKSIGLPFALPSDFNKEVISNNVNIQRAQNNPRVVTGNAMSMAIDSVLVN